MKFRLLRANGVDIPFVAPSLPTIVRCYGDNVPMDSLVPDRGMDFSDVAAAEHVSRAIFSDVSQGRDAGPARWRPSGRTSHGSEPLLSVEEILHPAGVAP